jgi:glutamate carboxypeptidase
MATLLESWSNVNSGSLNLAGLDAMLDLLTKHFSSLGAQIEIIALPEQDIINNKGLLAKQSLGRALRLKMRPEAPLQIFLGGHYDTVFAADHPFQKVRRLDENTLNGPGVADLKGGLIVMHKALETLEKSPVAKNIGWEVLINPDEEISSPGSTPLFEEAAKRNHLGLVFEPSLADGSIVAKRKGSGNFAVVVHGRSAHVGREAHLGRSAILALSEIIVELEALNGALAGIIVNVGQIEGGGSLNTVPNLAIGRFNVRYENKACGDAVLAQIEKILAKARAKDGITAELHGSLNRAPKDVTDGIAKLFQILETCAAAEGLKITRRDTGGVCDGNTLAAAGLANIDTLGVRGGGIHSEKEYVLLDSIVERTRLTARLLLGLASGDVKWK